MGVILITTGLVEDEQVRIRRCLIFVAPFARWSTPDIRHDFHVPTDEQEVAISKKDLVISKEIGAPLHILSSVLPDPDLFLQ